MESVVVLIFTVCFIGCNVICIYILLREPRIDLSDNNLEKVIREWKEET